MDAREALKLSIDMGRMVSMSYLEDLTDEEMMHRPCEGCNHINWQLGHLISAEHQMVGTVCPGAMPELPAGFAEKYAKEKATSDDASGFCTKQELLSAYEQQRAATLAALEALTDEDLDKPSPESMRAYVANVAAIFEMQGSHYLMHAGQWAVIRRQLGRPPLF